MRFWNSEGALSRAFQRSRSAQVWLLAGLFAMVVAPQMASASIEKFDVIKLSRSGSYGGANGGGRFDVYKLDTSSNNYVFAGTTFCLEFDEYVDLNTPILVGSRSMRAALGGVNTNSGDDLSFATDWLYQQYADGGLDNAAFSYNGNSYQFSYNSNTWNNALQRAIWVLEEEQGGFGNSSFSDEAEALYNYALSESAGMNNYSGSVWALNLFKMGTDVTDFDPYDESTWVGLESSHVQDQLWYFDDPNFATGSVPEPATVAIWSALGVAGVGFCRFRRRQKKA